MWYARIANFSVVGSLTLKQRLLMLQMLFLAGIVCILVACGWLEQRIEQQVVFPNFERQILAGHKDMLKTLVESEIQVLAQRIKGAKTRDEQIAIIQADTDPIRFFADHSGYFFTYDTTGVRIDVPINKVQNGQNLIMLKDSAGYLFVRGFVDAAVAGGGFVEYQFEKAGQGVHPKLSYVAPIPGTDFLVGTGVYIDDVKSERDALAQTLAKQTRQYYAYITSLCLLILGAMMGAGLLLSGSITKVVRKVADGLRASAGQVAIASSQLTLTSQSLAAGSSEQAASIEETSASLEEASSMTQRNAENVHTAKDLARQTRVAADQGVQDMQTMSQAMNAIQSSSNDIAKIIKAIDEIAFQTNILALNAAVEAARAGEAGMGFAVVADEVRSLAQRSAEAAKETAAKIEGAISRTGQGVTITNKVAAELNEILTKARQMDELASEIAAASKEQASGIGQINQAVGQMDKVTQANAANAEETAASAQELNGQALTLKHLVADLTRLVGGADRNADDFPAGNRPVGALIPQYAPQHTSAAAKDAKHGKTPFSNGRLNF
jgi:methyl-accepting chemotaxis protein